ncbi:MAG: 50S ribosomal protein L19 [Bacteroidia bacterium]|nr:50S ribosomal protein L19 [Bacteroidia bacterium]
MEELVKLIQAADLKEEVPSFKAGDTLNVFVRIIEGDKERTQQFKGVCIQRRGSSSTETFTVRKISGGVGVERIFPLHSPIVEKIEVLRRGKVRRARIFYLRDKIGKKARIKDIAN